MNSEKTTEILRLSRRNALLGGAALLSGISTQAFGKSDYPNRPIRLIVPYTPGGATDVVARIVAANLGKALGQSVIVENKPGAGGNIGTRFVVDAPSDGYTLLFTTTANAINESLYRNLPFKFAKDIQPISQLAELPNVLIVNNSLGVKNVAELIAYARANPGRLLYGSAGVGTSTHLAAELFKAMAKVDITHIPYKGSAPAMTDLRGGQIHLMFDNISSALPQIEGNAVRPLAVTSSQPWPQLLAIPTLAQSGLQGYEAVAWHGLGAPANMSSEIATKLFENVKSALQTPEALRQFETAGVRPVTSASPAAFHKHIASEISKWGQVVKASGATLD